MAKFKIAIWGGKEGSPLNGGSYSYPSELLNNIDKFNFHPDLEVSFIGFVKENTFTKPYLLLQNEEHFIGRKITNFLHKVFNIKIGLADRLEKKNHTKNIALLKQENIQLIFYPVNYIHYDNFPFIVNNWDLGHASMYAFPEITQTLEDRELYYDKFKKALFICAESEAGKKELIFHLNLLQKKVKVLPFFPAGLVHNDIIEEQPAFLNEDDPFFFYPAAFGAHKNHYGLVMAFHKFHKDHPDVKLILTGGDYVNKIYIQDLVNELDLKESVLFTGFVSNQNMKWLYKNSLGLVMPTYLGPTNMPLLEAQALGCRVACSDLEGHKELMDDYAIYFDPEKTEEIYDALLQLQTLSGQAMIISQTPKYSIHKTLDALNTIFLQAIPIRRTWGKD